MMKNDINPFNPNAVRTPPLFVGHSQQVRQIIKKPAQVRRGLTTNFLLVGERVALLLALLSQPSFTYAANKTSESYAIAMIGGPYHGDEVKVTSGEGWFGLYQTGSGFELRKVSINVTLVNDPVVDNQPEQKTGKQISVSPGSKDKVVILIKSQNTSSLAEGKVEGSLYETGTTIYPGQSQIARVGQNFYSLVGSGEAILSPGSQETTIKNYALHLFFRQQSQLLFSEKGALGQDGRPQLIWAGDLDRDGKLDLLLNLTTHYNSSRLTLLLSSAAKAERLVETVVELSTTGC